MRPVVLAAAAATLALAACHAPAANNVTETNTGDIVLNDAQANYAFRNDNETAANDTVANEAAAAHEADIDNGGAPSNAQ